ncbi:uncharacterized protein DFL_004202 [Arthrobotrys flagrans]|uniref:Transcription initiation factor TFIID subunit 8 n=1 Tax=Arthrobotrys flagrans TaxID=97331 RepID=A0A437A479_ARTFL|nr:hypothetical protein DFL_004202 [Arthrobotrys flagrans]
MGLGPPSKKRRVSPDGEAAAAGASGGVSTEPSRTLSQTSSSRKKKLPPIARQHMPVDAASTMPSSIVDPLLEQSIALVLKSYEFEGATKVALNHIRQMAGQFLQDITTSTMTYCASQRRTRPTITDFEETLGLSGYTTADLEDEITRYRRSLTTHLPDTQEPGTPSLTNGTTRKPTIPKPHIYKLPDPDPAPPDQPSLIDLLGPELLKPRKRYKLPPPPRPSYMAQLEQANPNNPKFAAQTKPTITVQTERAYIDPHQPAWPGKHTYEHHEEVREIVRDAKKLRELASEEARQSGETLRKLLAEFSKASTATRNRGETNGGSAKKNGSEIYKGGNARRKRDEMFEKTWMNVIKSIETEKDKAKAELEEKRRQRKEKREQARSGTVNGLFDGGNLMEIDFDDESSDDEVVETAEKETQIDEKGLLDTVVNCEKALFAKGAMRRVMFR